MARSGILYVLPIVQRIFDGKMPGLINLAFLLFVEGVGRRELDVNGGMEGKEKPRLNVLGFR
jgi:hypothetical protein